MFVLARVAGVGWLFRVSTSASSARHRHVRRFGKTTTTANAPRPRSSGVAPVVPASASRATRDVLSLARSRPRPPRTRTRSPTSTRGSRPAQRRFRLVRGGGHARRRRRARRGRRRRPVPGPTTRRMRARAQLDTTSSSSPVPKPPERQADRGCAPREPEDEFSKPLIASLPCLAAPHLRMVRSSRVHQAHAHGVLPRSSWLQQVLPPGARDYKYSRHVMVAVDGTEESERAVEWSIRNLCRSGDLLHICHVSTAGDVDPRSAAYYSGPPDPRSVVDAEIGHTVDFFPSPATSTRRGRRNICIARGWGARSSSSRRFFSSFPGGAPFVTRLSISSR